MKLRSRRSWGIATLLVMVATTVSACADSGNPTSSNASPGSPSAAQSLLRQSLQGKHRITSGVLSLRATITPHGSATGSPSITVSFGGPFQDRGSGHAAQSDFTVAVAGAGQRLSLGVRTTATAGYLRLNGDWFALPAKQFARLRRRLGAADAGGSASLPGLSVGLLKWLTDPQLLGGATVDGAATTEIQARIDVNALASALGAVLANAGANPALRSSGVTAKLPAAERRQLVAELQNPTVQLFIGRADHTLRRIVLALNLKVPAKVAAKLPGISSVRVAATVDYTQLNRPQTITAPAHVKPSSQLGQQLSGLAEQLAGSAGAHRSGSGAQDSTYDGCRREAGGNLTKLQKCASLIDAPTD